MSWRSSFSASPSPALAVTISTGWPSASGSDEVDDPAVVVGRAVALLRLVAIEDADGHRGPGEAGADVGGEIGAGGAVGQFTDGAVGKGDAHRALMLDHVHAHALGDGGAVGVEQLSLLLAALGLGRDLEADGVAPASSVTVLTVLPRLSFALASAEEPSTSLSVRPADRLRERDQRGAQLRLAGVSKRGARIARREVRLRRREQVGLRLAEDHVVDRGEVGLRAVDDAGRDRGVPLRTWTSATRSPSRKRTPTNESP